MLSKILCTMWLKNSMELIPSWEANTQVLRYSRYFSYFMELEGSLLQYMGPLPVPILSQINPVHAPHPISWRSVLISSFCLRLYLPSGLFTSGFSTKILYAPLLSQYVLHTLISQSFLLDNPYKYLVTNRHQKAPRYAVSPLSCCIVPLGSEYIS